MLPLLCIYLTALVIGFFADSDYLVVIGYYPWCVLNKIVVGRTYSETTYKDRTVHQSQGFAFLNDFI